MKTKFTFLLTILFFGWAHSQQHEEFKKVREYYNRHRGMIGSEFKKKYDVESNEHQKKSILKDFELFMQKIDSIENFAMISALVIVKNQEDLSRILAQKNNTPPSSNVNSAKESTDPTYPGGINTLREQVAKLIYTQDLQPSSEPIRTTVYFVVEKDGKISSVQAQGDNIAFNRQAEIAVYLLPQQFTPAFFNNTAIRYRYKLPLALKID